MDYYIQEKVSRRCRDGALRPMKRILYRMVSLDGGTVSPFFADPNKADEWFRAVNRLLGEKGWWHKNGPPSATFPF